MSMPNKSKKIGPLPVIVREEWILGLSVITSLAFLGCGRLMMEHLPNPLWSSEANPGSVIRLLGTGCRRGGNRGSLPQALGFGAQRVPRG